MNERWLPVPGYEGRYEVSTRGRVWSHLSKQILRPVMHSVGYYSVGLRVAGRRATHYVHRLVAEAFLERPVEGGRHEVCHADGDPLNNALSNLRWGTRADNMRDAVRHNTHHQSRKTHCKRGHEFTPENTRRVATGRSCIACERLRHAQHPRKEEVA